MTAARVLVVEDEPRIAHFLAKALRLDGHEVVVAEDGEVAVFLSLTEPFDALVLDLTLPGRSGLEVLATVHAERPDVSVLMLTGRDDPAARRQAPVGQPGRGRAAARRAGAADTPGSGPVAGAGPRGGRRPRPQALRRGLPRRRGPRAWPAPADRSGRPDEVDPVLRSVALRAAAALDLEVCGIDVLVTADGPVVVDVNAWPGFKGVPGAAERLSAHLLARIGSEEVLTCASSS